MRSWGSKTAGHAEQTDRRCQCAVTENHEITKDSRRESKPCGYHKLRRLNIFYNLGAGKLERVRKCCKLVLKTGLTYSVLLWLVIQQIPTLFPNIFAEDENPCEIQQLHDSIFLCYVMGHGRADLLSAYVCGFGKRKNIPVSCACA